MSVGLDVVSIASNGISSLIDVLYFAPVGRLESVSVACRLISAL